MTNVSKTPLGNTERQKLFQYYAKIYAHQPPRMVQALFAELLTDTEQIMLLKRVAAIVMCFEQCSVYKISQTLKLSQTTVSKLMSQYTNGAYQQVEKRLRSNDFDVQAFWKFVDSVLRVGLPPIVGPGRWGNNAAVRGTRTKYSS